MDSQTLQKDSGSRMLRNVVAVSCVAVFSLALYNYDTTFSTKESSHVKIQEAAFSYQYQSIAGLGYDGKFHQSGLGGIYNVNHLPGARARRNLSRSNVRIPVSATPEAVPSLSEENIINFRGHYVHDEHRSPYSSFLYNRTTEELDAEQKEYEEKMNQIRTEWGAWNFKDEHPEIRPIANFDKIPYKDMMNSEFPAKSWQMDQKYVTDFIDEARKLVHRVREGIYAEYGFATKDLNEAEIKERNELFAVHVTDDAVAPQEKEGWAWINKRGLEMYAKKLLHSMITNDEFYYVMGGHSSAVGHGNNQVQSYMMEHANIVEPLMHRLGVRLIVRNLAMGGLGTTHFSFGASTLYGETDVIYWDSSMTEKGCDDQDLFHKQNLLGGERYPVLLNGCTANLKEETRGELWYGNLMNTWGNGNSVKMTTSLDQGATLPWAVQYLKCDPTVSQLCNGKSVIPNYHSTCWVDRSDVVPAVKQDAFPGGRASWHPGDRVHKFHGRTHTMLMLRALDEALNLWEDGIQTDGFPLKETYWHVGPTYKAARGNLSNHLNNEGRGTSECEKKWVQHPGGLDRACRRSFKGMAQFTPINRGYHNSISKHIKHAPNGYVPKVEEEKLYDGADILPLEWKIPKGHVDVHAITIASTYSPSELDQSWVTDEDDEEDAEISRRNLRVAAMENLSITEETSAANYFSRGLGLDDVKQGQGWIIEQGGIVGYCDGSPMSQDCKRSNKEKCLLSGHNDAHNTIAGNALSGWLVVNIPNVQRGLIFAKLQWWDPRNIAKTKDWTEINNGIDGYRRKLGGKVTDWPEDIEIDIAVNNKIVKSYDYETFKTFTKEFAYNEAYYPLIDDETITGDIELGIRMKSTINPQHASFGVTHIYWD